jgi:hypothetical protein
MFKGIKILTTWTNLLLVVIWLFLVDKSDLAFSTLRKYIVHVSDTDAEYDIFTKF